MLLRDGNYRCALDVLRLCRAGVCCSVSSVGAIDNPWLSCSLTLFGAHFLLILVLSPFACLVDSVS
jgi:hypothetical protein